MSFKTIILLAFAASTFARAHPKRHAHFHQHPSGSGVSLEPSGGAWPDRNDTGGWFSGSWSAEPTASETVEQTVTSTASSVAMSTVTVIPLPASSSVASVAAVAAEVATTSSSCSGTTTITSTDWFTETVAPAAGSPEASAVVTSSSVVTTSFSTSPSPSFSTSTSVSVAQDTSVAAGAFFQRPSGGPASSAAAPVPTTFATSMVASSAASAASVSWASSSAPAPSSTGTSGGSSSGKRGLSYNTASLTDAFSGLGMSWAYNWAATPDGTILSGLEYVPMLWGLSSTSAWSAAASSAISSGSSHLLSFNEPDLSTQSNISPSVAATNHIQFMNPFSGKAQIGSPAVTNGAGSSPPMGTTWLSQFFTACAGNCKVDFVAFHWYNDASQIADFKSHVADVISTAAANGVSKVWLTEFGVTGADSDVESFLQEALPFLDSQAAVERYAYFMCGTADGQLISGTSLSAVGQIYAA